MSKKKVVIRLNQVSKQYELLHEKPTLVENILNRHHSEKFWALKNITFEVSSGDRLGIIGPNGSGKTTLLEIISGITTPTSGELDVSGKVISLIDLEAGFHPDLTGEENLYLNGLLLGMNKKAIREKRQKILDFAGIGSFIDTPIYTYSSGMKLRLGFSIALHAEPDILILDETMSVGDKDFRNQAEKRIRSLIKEKITVIMVSHDIYQIKGICNKAMILNQGTILKRGTATLFDAYSKNQY